MDKDARQKLLEERILIVDAVVASPKERAGFIHGVLTEHAPTATQWDLICAFSELLGAYANAEPALEDVIKPLLKRVYTIHYFHGGDLKSCITKSNSTPPPSDTSYTPPSEQLKLTAPIDDVL